MRCPPHEKRPQAVHPLPCPATPSLHSAGSRLRSAGAWAPGCRATADSVGDGTCRGTQAPTEGTSRGSEGPRALREASMAPPREVRAREGRCGGALQASPCSVPGPQRDQERPQTRPAVPWQRNGCSPRHTPTSKLATTICQTEADARTPEPCPSPTVPPHATVVPYTPPRAPTPHQHGSHPLVFTPVFS